MKEVSLEDYCISHMDQSIKIHRQALVVTLIRSLKLRKRVIVDPKHDGAFNIPAQTKIEGCVCVATGLFFPRLMSEQVTCSNYGDIWMGVWLDEPLKLDEGHGNTLFPRWLAEVLKTESKLSIKEEDIYD